ncbi:hypothetical protein DPMN_127670 [Dreissena polymorpha]|uniref:Uncharacterized protein n=1 Tax=Dreissena polymorpha TaxID=45954 RepID=A0A9D4GZD1_DREPO|nr:hypothetical protein DPMN_127670 [Dreissena polymorpha]
MPRDLFEVSHHEQLDALESLKLQHSSAGCTVESVEEIRAEIAPSHTKSLDSIQVIHTMGSLRRN